jgi:hypothetical protein
MEECATPSLTGLTDAITIQETKTKNRPKVVYPGRREALPHAVAARL